MKMNIDGITYVVVSVSEYTHKGNLRQIITLRRPKGRRNYKAVRYENGVISAVH